MRIACLLASAVIWISAAVEAGQFDKWVEKEVKWIASRQESKQFKQLRTDEERRAFIERFWLRRDPTPDTERNEYKEQFYSRFEHANRNFREGIPGWRTDRGRVYIIHGPPNQVEYLSIDSTTRRRGVPSSAPAIASGPSSGRESIVWTYFSMPTARYYRGRLLVVFQPAIGMTEQDVTLGESIQGQNQGQRIWSRGGVQPADLITVSNRYRIVSAGRPGAVTSRGTDAPLVGIGDQARILEDLLRSPGDLIEERETESKRRDQSRTQMRQQVAASVVFADLPLAMKTISFPEKEMANLDICWQIPFSSLDFRKEKNLRMAKIDLIAQIRDQSGQLVDEIFKSLDLAYGKDELKKLQKESFFYLNEFNLPYGEYEITSIFKDVSTGQSGVASERIAMTKPDRGQVALSDLVLARTVTNDFNPALGRNLVQGDLQVVPQPDPVFALDDKMVLFFKIFNSQPLQGNPSLVADYKFLNQEGVVSRSGPRAFSEFTDPEAETVTFSSIVDLSELKPGEYQLHVSVVDFHSKKFAIERTRFEIK